MRKSALHFPGSAVSDGRIGTARIRDQVAGAAARLASSGPVGLDRALGALVGGAPASPVERMRALGRQPRGQMNKTESAYAQLLDAELAAGLILWFRFEALKLRLADNTFYTPDFPVITASGSLEFREVKGRWTDDARVKIKVAATQYPFRFLAIQRAGSGWRTEDLTSRTW